MFYCINLIWGILFEAVRISHQILQREVRLFGCRVQLGQANQPPVNSWPGRTVSFITREIAFHNSWTLSRMSTQTTPVWHAHQPPHSRYFFVLINKPLIHIISVQLIYIVVELYLRGRQRKLPLRCSIQDWYSRSCSMVKLMKQNILRWSSHTTRS